MPEFGLRKLRDLLAPALTAAWTTLESYRPDFLRILALSALAVGLEAAGLSAIWHLVRLFTRPDTHWTSWFPVPHDPVVLTLASVVFLTAGVRLKYRLARQANGLAYRAGTRAGVLALASAHALAARGELHPAGERERRNAMGRLLKDIPFACGFAANGFTMICTHVVQITVLLAILLWLSPLLTLVLLLIAVAVFALLAGSFGFVVGIANERRERGTGFRREAAQLADELFDGSLNTQEFTARAEHALNAGNAKQQLALRLSQRRELRSGSLVIEYAYPIAILCISLLFIYGGDFSPEISDIALFFLLMRQTISSLYGIGSTLMSFSRHHLPLSIYRELVSTGSPPVELFSGGDEIDDDE